MVGVCGVVRVRGDLEVSGGDFFPFILERGKEGGWGTFFLAIDFAEPTPTPRP